MKSNETAQMELWYNIFRECLAYFVGKTLVLFQIGHLSLTLNHATDLDYISDQLASTNEKKMC